MSELKRIINVRYLVFAGILLVLNAILIINNNRSNESVSQVFDEMVKLAAANKTETNSNNEAGTLAWEQYFSEHNITDRWFINEQTEEQAAVGAARDLLMAQADYIDGFDAMLQERIQTAVRIIQSDIYEQDSFEYINLLKTRYDLSNLKKANIEMSNGVWLEQLYNYSYVQIFSLLMVFITVYSFFSEKKTGLYYIIHAAKNGRARLFVTRCVIVFLEALIINAIFYIEAMLLFLSIYKGKEGITLAAAGDEVFLMTAGSLTRIEFVGVLILTASITTAVLSLMLWFILSFFRNTNIGLFVYLILCSIEIMVYILISPKSILKAFHYINIYYLFFPSKLLTYYNWGYSSAIFSLTKSSISFALVLGAAVLVFNLHMNINAYYTGKQNIIEIAINNIMEGFLRLLVKSPIIFKELYKILISQKAIIILFMLLYAATKIHIGAGVFYNAATSYLSGYYENAKGLSYGAELEDIYDKYLQEYNEAIENIDYSVETSGSVLQYRQYLLASIRGNIDYIKGLNEKGVNAVVIKPYEYEGAFGSEQSSNQKELALLNVLAVLVIASGYISYEKKNEMHRLALSFANRRSWLKRKIFASLLLTAIFEITSYGIYYHRLFNTFDLQDLSVPIKSLPMFQRYIFNPSVGGFIVTDLVVKFIILASLSMIMCFISIYVKYIYCLLGGMLVVLPQLLYMIGFEALDKLSIGRYTAFLPCFNEGTGSTFICYGIYAVMVIIGLVIYCYITKRETVKR